MGMIVGGATVTVVEYRHSGTYVEAYRDRLLAVLDMIDHGSLGDGGFYGCEEHKAALVSVEQQIAKTRQRIAEIEADDSNLEPPN